MKQSFNPVRLFGEAMLVVALTECLVLLAPPVLTPGPADTKASTAMVAMLLRFSQQAQPSPHDHLHEKELPL